MKEEDPELAGFLRFVVMLLSAAMLFALGALVWHVSGGALTGPP